MKVLCQSCFHFVYPQVSAAPSQTFGFSSRSAMENSSKMTHRETSTAQSSFHTSHMLNRSSRSKSLCQEDQRTLPLAGGVHPENSSVPITVPPPSTLRRSLSGILAQERGQWQEELPYQYTYKGPSHRTISRITNRQQYYQQPISCFGQDGWLGNGRGVSTAGDSWGGQWQQHASRANHTVNISQNASLHRAASLHSLRSVGKGADITDAASIHSNDPLAQWDVLS